MRNYFLTLLFGVCVVIALFSVINPLTVAEGKSEVKKYVIPDSGLDNEEKKIFELVNKERRKYSLESLEWDSNLADLARSYSKKMAQEHFFSHYDSRGNSVVDRAKAMRIKKWQKIGENLFMCEGYEKYSYTAVKGWMNSPGHRQNILDENYNQTGIGIAKASDGTIFVTQVFLQS